jgi:hypothetical protein
MGGKHGLGPYMGVQGGYFKPSRDPEMFVIYPGSLGGRLGGNPDILNA